MSIGTFSEWRKLPISLTELCINTTLRCGQSFRWQKSGDNEWSCALYGRIVSLRQDPTHLHYRSYFPSGPRTLPTPPSSVPASRREESSYEKVDDTEALISNYFNLDLNLTDLYEQWSTADKNFKKKAPQFTGIRILRQDAWEALISFICSSNNNIARISQMVEKLCLNYGPLIGYIDKKPYHDFPTPQALIGRNVEARLRELGFGYRAKYIYQTALTVANDREKGWLNSLRNPECPSFGASPVPIGEMAEGGREGYRRAHECLLELQGVGPKVADCACLMGLGWGEAVPVDTHVWQIAQRDYKFGKGKHKSLTKATYDAVGNHFRNLWGKQAGWAHSVLFTADLKSFSARLASKVEVDVKTTGKKEHEIKTETAVQISVKREISDDFEETKMHVEAVETESKPVTKKRRTRRG
ncbi:N-glycosylase/DNA lyase [[Emmonsia] crescens]|uniref:DNA-(apurinic or apyrimidinic site) lyase n=1 Tax=[Emmonsia] crescens TaxID=73230 RepID=A0A0G2J975_9EURO|nr:N-glycosylase/DNA lyase [Emmonsia crescens UAMH 3008]